MTTGGNILALETATDACSVALALGGELRSLHEVAPRQHQQRLFAMIDELAGGAALASLGIDLLVYGRGPGSFTGLRIAAAAAQGLAFSLGVPVVGVSTLACQAASARRRGPATDGMAVLSTIDARIGELYWGLYECRGDGLRERLAPAVCRPEDLPSEAIAAALEPGVPLCVVGSGALFSDSFPAGLPALQALAPALVPEARDLLALGRAALAAGAASSPAAVAPLYVQGGERWKKLPAQGPAPR